MPQVAVERSEFGLHFQKRLCVLHYRQNLQAVAHNAFIIHQRVHLPLVVTGNLLYVEVVERRAIIFALLENGVPTEAGLRALEDKELEQHAVVMLRDAPFAIVIENGEIVRRPCATDYFLF